MPKIILLLPATKLTCVQPTPKFLKYNGEQYASYEA